MAENTNLKIYNALREVPDDAQKTISAGRLKGMTDINPMWRIKALTEQFGPCGIGWKYEIDDQWTEESPETKEIAAFCNLRLYIKYKDAWSDPIYGTGGSMFVASERNGLHASDECYKMALTDAISVACKALGVGADVYWNKDKTKYDSDDTPSKPKDVPQEAPKMTYEKALKYKVGDETLDEIIKRDGMKSLRGIYNAGDRFCREAINAIMEEAAKRRTEAAKNASEGK